MPRVPTFSPTFDRSRKRWVLSIPPKYSESKKRSRKFFETEADARAFAKKLQDSTEASRKAFHRAGPELIRSAVNYDEILRAVYGFEGGLSEGCEELIRRLDQERKAARIGELVDAYEKDFRGDWSPQYLTKWSWVKNAVEPLNDRVASTLDGNFWTEWLRESGTKHGWADSTVNELQSKIRSILKHGVALSLIDRNPLDGLRGRKIRRSEKHVYTVDEVTAIMNTAWKHDRELVPFYGFAIFAGLRPGVDSEIENLLWEDVDFESRQVCAGRRFDNKTGDRRFIDIEDNLMEWLTPWRAASGKVTPVNLTARRRWLVKGKYEAEEGSPESDWITIARNGSEFRDITRHTYGSFLDAKYQDRNKVKEFMGHRNFETYDQHYRNARTRAEAEQFWSIRPPSGSS